MTTERPPATSAIEIGTELIETSYCPSLPVDDSDGSEDAAFNAASASVRRRRPTNLPSERVTSALVSFWRCIRSTISASVMLGRTVLGPAVITASTVTSSSEASALRPSRPSTTPEALTTGVPAGGAYPAPHVLQPLLERAGRDVDANELARTKTLRPLQR